MTTEFTYVSIAPWLRDLTVITPGCPPKIRKRMFQQAAREFFEQSCVWRAVIGPEDHAAGEVEYELSPFDDNAVVTRVHRVEYKGSGIAAMAARPHGDEPDAVGFLAYYLDAPDKVHLWPTLSTEEEDALTFFVSLQPEENFTLLPQFAQTHLFDALFDGAAGRLLAQPAKPYSDPTRAQYHLQRFRAAIGKYSAQGKSNFSGAPTWCFPRFGK